MQKLNLGFVCPVGWAAINGTTRLEVPQAEQELIAVAGKTLSALCDAEHAEQLSTGRLIGTRIAGKCECCKVEVAGQRWPLYGVRSY